MNETQRSDMYHAALLLLGGKPRQGRVFAPTVDGFGEYLAAVGVRYFSAPEMTTPHQPDKAEACGFDVFLPEPQYWHFGATLALVADRCRAAAGGPVACRNWWRPQPYNLKVSGGNPKGDHPNYCAVDLDYQSDSACDDAVDVLRKLDRSGLLKMSLGIGKRTTHVGLFSPLGARHWSY